MFHSPHALRKSLSRIRLERNLSTGFGTPPSRRESTPLLGKVRGNVRMAAMLFVPFCILLALPAPVVAAPPRPNIVVILMDDLGATDLGCCGSKYYRTPHLDRLASQGMRFTQAYAACPVCSPTRAAILTGKNPTRIGLTDWIPGSRNRIDRRLLNNEFLQQLPLEEVTLAEIFASAGYATASIGKWHLGGEGFSPHDQGFQVALAGLARGGVNSHFAPFLKDSAQLPGLESVPDGEYLADRLTEEAEKFIDTNASRPFFLYLPHYSVHTPIQGPKALADDYRQNVTPANLQKNPIYAAMIENMDNNVARILKKLDDHQIADNTIVIFTSDNGGLATIEGPNTPATNNAPFREGKGYLYEGGLRVPLLIRWPSVIKPASICSVPVVSYDFLPTLAEICGLSVPENIDGVSIRPLLEGNPSLPRETLYWHYPHYGNQGGQPGAAIRDGDFKLIEFYETDRRELFNVASDVGEGTNLTDREPELVRTLAEKLDAWRKSLHAEMPQPNPDYSPVVQDEDGIVTLPARRADVHGIMLRYEPLPHKNTVGYWVRPDDWVSWEFHLRSPGEYDVEILQGCGNGSGGSTIELRIGDKALTTTVQETGGFQQFVPRTIGSIYLQNVGSWTLEVKCLKKPGLAVMDLREVRLIPKKK